MNVWVSVIVPDITMQERHLLLQRIHQAIEELPSVSKGDVAGHPNGDTKSFQRFVAFPTTRRMEQKEG